MYALEAYADLQQKCKLLQIALRFLQKHIHLQFKQIGSTDKSQDKRISYVQFLGTTHHNYTRPITGVWLEGIGRKPQWLHGEYTEEVVTANPHLARIHHADSAATTGNVLDKSDPKAQARNFGIGYMPKTKHVNITPKWIAPSMIMIQCDINEQLASLLPTTISTLTG